MHGRSRLRERPFWCRLDPVRSDPRDRTDQRETHHLWIELLEVYPLLTRIFEEGIATAASWDGSNPIRNIEYAEIQAS